MSGDFVVKYEKSKQRIELDNDVFETCKVKHIKSGLFRKSLVFLHFDGETWNLLRVNNDWSKIENFQFK